MNCFLFAVLAVAFAQTVNYGNGNSAQFTSGGSNGGGGFQISTNGNWMSLQWATLSEVDVNGNSVQTVDLSKHHFGWSQPEVLTVPQVNGYASTDHFPAVNFSEQLENGAWFNVTAWLIDADANNSDAKHGDVKWSIYISNWPWVNGANFGGETPFSGDQLVLTAGLVGFGGMVRSQTNQASKGTAVPSATYILQNVTYANGFLASPTQALYDNSLPLRPVHVGHTVSGKPIVTWTFDYFQTSVMYDPVLGKAGGGGGSTGGGNGGGSSKNPGTVAASSGAAQFNSDGSFGISTNGNWMGLQWATITEYAPDGTVVQSVDLSKHHFGWSQPDVYTVLDDLQYTTVDKMPHVNFTATLVNGATFIVDAWIYTNDSQVNSNKRDDVKFTITIKNWAWVGTGSYNYGGEVPGAYSGDYLVLTAGLVGYGGIVRSWDNTGAGTNATLVQGDFVYGVLISPDQAAYDGVYHPVTVSHTLSGKPEVSWTFTYFQNQVTYDPTQRDCGGHCPQQQAVFLGSPGMISMTVILGVVAIGLMVMLFVYIIRSAQRYRSGTYQMDKAQESGDVPMSSDPVSSNL